MGDSFIKKVEIHLTSEEEFVLDLMIKERYEYLIEKGLTHQAKVLDDTVKKFQEQGVNF